MRCLQVIETLGRGGAEQLLVTLCPELKRQGCETIVAVRTGPLDLAPALAAENIRIIELPKRRKWALWGAARDIAKLAKSEKIDVIHAHLYFPAVTTSLAKFARMTRAKTCVSFHNLAYGGANRPSPTLRIRKVLARILYRLGMDGFIAVSDAVSHHYKSHMGLNSITTLHNPIDLSKFPKPTAANTPHIVIPGRLVHEKGHIDFLDAYGLIDSPKPAITFVGGGPLHDNLKTEIDARGWSDLITISNTQTHLDLLTIVNSASLVVIPSRFEGFGLTALEAMALAKPVIATDAGGLPELVQDAGLIVPKETPNALAEAIDKLLRDHKLASQLANAAQARAQSAFALPKQAQTLIGFYNNLQG